jgi:hypothetical protein
MVSGVRSLSHATHQLKGTDSRLAIAAMAMSKDIKVLNDMVSMHTAKAIAGAETSKGELPIEFEFAQRPKSILYAGLPIYEDRFTSIVYGICVLSTGLALKSGYEIGLIPSFIVTLLAFMLYDFFSGALHIVLDHPPFIRLPFLGQACLEFQWHHIIPDDLCRKDFSQVLGDINVAVLVMLPLNLFYWSGMGADPLISFIIAMKVLFAYLGQWSHRSAHQVQRKNRDPVTQFLQNVGVLTSVGQHHKHHTPPHNTNFCLIGICNSAIGTIFEHTNANVQLAFFASLVFFDVPLLAWVLRKTLFDF